MKFENLKIQPSEISANGVVSAPDRLSGTAAENKAVFDRIVGNVVAEKFNSFVDLVREEIESVETPPKGEDGEPGYTPVKGVDYWTEEEQEEIKGEVLEALREEDLAEIDEKLSGMEEVLAELSAKAYFLNFAVIGGTTQPENPEENTIWVNTSAEISGWEFSATQVQAKEGLVWIITGKESPAEFNALNENGVRVYPLSAKQYVSGAWVEKEAKSYIGGEWHDWLAYFYRAGNEYEDITGGWVNMVKYGSAYSGMASLTKESNGIKVVTAGAVGSIISGRNKIDLSNYKTLTLKASGVAPRILGLYVLNNFNLDNWLPSSIAAYKDFAEYTIGELSLDVANLSGGYYVAVGVASGSGDSSRAIYIEEVGAQ